MDSNEELRNIPEGLVVGMVEIRTKMGLNLEE